VTSPLRRRSVALALAVALGAGVTGGCSFLDSAPEPNAAAQALADGLGAADLGAVPLAGATGADATAFVKAAYEGMGDLRPSVTVTAVKHQPEAERATATLITRWDVSDSPTDWRYETQADLRLVDGAWQVAWTPGLVAPDLTHVASRLSIGAGTYPMTRGHLQAWIADPQSAKPGNQMPVIGLEPAELRAVTEYVASLK
jgi:cytochrome c1